MSRSGRQQPGGIVALRDADGDGKRTKEPFGKGSTTGIALRNGYLYAAKPKTVERYKMTPGTAEAVGRTGNDRRRCPNSASMATRASRLTARARST